MSNRPSFETVHATAVAIQNNGVFLIGASGVGKSDLALRLIDRGAKLVSDDIVLVDATQAPPMLHVAPNISGKLEVRGVGIIELPYVDDVPLRLVVDLDSKPERLPSTQTHYIFGVELPCIALTAFEASAPIKIEYALRSIVDGAIIPVEMQSAVNHEGRSA